MTKTDHEQVQELMASYANAIDAKDYGAIGDCFTQDAEAKYSDFSPLLRGREAILLHMRKALEPLRVTQHIFGNFIVDTDGDAGTASCAIIAQHIGPESDPKTYLSGGQYSLKLRRSAGRWQIASAMAQEVWSSGAREMLPRQGGS
ncbi:MAG: nuclear transport factor 2 family protein [Novosphingobium sp.]